MFQFLFKYPSPVFTKGRFVLLSTWPKWLLPVLIVAFAAGLGGRPFGRFLGATFVALRTLIADASIMPSITTGKPLFLNLETKRMLIISNILEIRLTLVRVVLSSFS